MYGSKNKSKAIFKDPYKVFASHRALERHLSFVGRLFLFVLWQGTLKYLFFLNVLDVVTRYNWRYFTEFGKKIKSENLQKQALLVVSNCAVR
jgi:uncharacterized metal-binding protein